MKWSTKCTIQKTNLVNGTTVKILQDWIFVRNSNAECFNEFLPIWCLYNLVLITTAIITITEPQIPTLDIIINQI